MENEPTIIEEYWDTQPFKDYVAYVSLSSNVIAQWLEEAGVGEKWEEQVQAMRQQGYLSGENTTYNPDLS